MNDSNKTDKINQLDEDRALYDRAVATEAELTAAEEARLQAKAAYAEVLASHLSPHDIDVHIERLTDAEQACEDADRRVKLLGNKVTALRDAVHPARVAARHRQIAELKSQEQALHEEQEKFGEKKREHLDAIRAIDTEIGARHVRIQHLATEMARVVPRSSMPLQVSVRTADVFRPPAGVMVTGSAWRSFIERARAEELDHVHIIINEASGTIATGALKQEVRS